MAGKLIIDTIQTEASFLQMNVSNTRVATINASGIFSNTGTKMIGYDGSLGVATIANTAITGVITGSQIASPLTLTGNVAIDTTTLVVDATNDKVGMGTATPNTRLHVTGTGSGIFGVYDDVVKLKGSQYTFLHLEGTNNQSGIVMQANTTCGYLFSIAGQGQLRLGRMTAMSQDGISNAKDASGNGMIMDQNGRFLFGTTNANPGGTAGSGGIGLNCNTDGNYYPGVIQASADGNASLVLNRSSDDGNIVAFKQGENTEGTISVSGTTVSYNGGHLARYSQLPTGERDDTILKGTVMSNLDEMCEWLKDGEPTPNEQLNKMKVSDVEGDKNVAGVFVNWDNDDADNTFDMNIAMTGDMIIRIAEGVTVQKGDLLMSAGDGTAKPQSDDIVRAKTIAKVTSNYVTCTYEDGSYCVPCVLMAC